MTVLDPGHYYSLNQLDDSLGLPLRLQFVKRVGPGYPGNERPHPGTTLQEVLRACIDRVKYVDNQIHATENDHVLDNLRGAIHFLERRAARRHDRQLNLSLEEICHIEDMPTCPKCGHIQCDRHEQL